MAGDEERTARSGWVFFEHGAETSSDWFHHLSGHGKEAGVAEIPWIVLRLVSAKLQVEREGCLLESQSER